MVGPLILHAPGDGAAADRLAEGLRALGPTVAALHPISPIAKPGDATPLILVWSRRAAHVGMVGAFLEAADAHDGPVFVCASYGEDPPDGLADYRLIAPDIDAAEFNAALRAQQIFVRERREQEARRAAAERRRMRARSGRAFAGGAVMGFATSVALVGALGAGAISAASQINQPPRDTDPAHPLPPPGVPMIQPLAHDAEVSGWSGAQLETVSYAQQVAFVEQELARAEAAMNAAPRVKVVPAMVETRFADASDEDMWRPSDPRFTPVAPLTQVAALDARLEEIRLQEVPSLAPDFWRMVARAGAVEAPSPAAPPAAENAGEEGLWRPS